MPIIIPANSAAAGGDLVTNAVRFNTQSSTEYMQRNMSNTGNLQAWTVSVWVKRAVISDGQHMLFASYYNSSNSTECFFEGNDSLNFRDNEGGSFVFQKKTTQLFRDPSAWYHLVMSSSAGTQRIYVNGVEVTSWATNTNGSGTSTWNGPYSHSIAANVNGGADKSGLYMAEFTSIDGQTLAASSFGEFSEDSEIWVPKDVTELTFGTNGFYLPFQNSSALGEDFSGNNLDFATNNMDATNQVTDTCQNNFSTMNPLSGSLSNNTLSEGNCVIAVTSGWRWRPSTICPSTGKWYAEFKPTSGGNIYTSIGVTPQVSWDDIDAEGIGQGANSEAKSVGYGSSGNVKQANSTVYSGSSYAPNDIVGVAMDLDNYKVYFSKNGTYQNSGNPESGATGTGAVSLDSTLTDWSVSPSAAGTTVSCNYGNAPYAISSGNSDENDHGNFEYAPPAGYLAMCTKNVSETDS